MVLFCDPPGHAQAVCDGTTHKPYIVQDPNQPNHEATIHDHYTLVSFAPTPGWKQKYVHRAWATDLAGPWTWDTESLIPVGRV